MSVVIDDYLGIQSQLGKLGKQLAGSSFNSLI